MNRMNRMKRKEHYPALYAVRDARRSGKRFLLLTLLVALCVGGAVFADGLHRMAEPVVSAYSGEILTVGGQEYRAFHWASKAATVGGTMRVSGWVLSWVAAAYACSSVLNHETQSAAVLSALGVRQETILGVMRREVLLLLIPSVFMGFLGGSGVLRLYLRRLAADGTLPAVPWRAQSGLVPCLILTAGLVLAAAVPLLVMYWKLGGKSVGVLFREGERE